MNHLKYPCKVSKNGPTIQIILTDSWRVNHDQGQEVTIGGGVNDAFQVFISVQKPH